MIRVAVHLQFPDLSGSRPLLFTIHDLDIAIAGLESLPCTKKDRLNDEERSSASESNTNTDVLDLCRIDHKVTSSRLHTIIHDRSYTAQDIPMKSLLRNFAPIAMTSVNYYVLDI